MPKESNSSKRRTKQSLGREEELTLPGEPASRSRAQLLATGEEDLAGAHEGSAGNMVDSY